MEKTYYTGFTVDLNYSLFKIIFWPGLDYFFILQIYLNLANKYFRPSRR
jgi:hypothetical protein